MYILLKSTTWTFEAGLLDIESLLNVMPCNIMRFIPVVIAESVSCWDINRGSQASFLWYLNFVLALLYNFTSVYTNIPSCRRDDSKKSLPLQEGIFVYSRVFVQ